MNAGPLLRLSAPARDYYVDLIVAILMLCSLPLRVLNTEAPTYSSMQNHRFTYDEAMGVEACTQAICDLALRFGEDRKGGAKEDIMVRA